MITYRFKFTKEGRVKYIGHLDVLLVFQRAMKRAELPIAYSQGFNPHQIISFALPLSLGYTSTGDYGDFKLTEVIDEMEIKNRLNATMPDGIVVTEIVRLKTGVKNTMSSVERARYRIIFNDNITSEDVKNNLEGFLNQEEILVMKKTKKGIKEADIKEDIFYVKDESENGLAIFAIEVSAGSVRNLKAESVAEGFCKFIGKEYSKFEISYIREDMLMNKEESFVPLTYGVEFDE